MWYDEFSDLLSKAPYDPFLDVEEVVHVAAWAAQAKGKQDEEGFDLDYFILTTRAGEGQVAYYITCNDPDTGAMSISHNLYRNLFRWFGRENPLGEDE